MSKGVTLPAFPAVRIDTESPTGLGWVAAELALTVELDDGAPPSALAGMIGLALRRNPRRAHLLVSRVLGKHIPVDPVAALGSAAQLAHRVRIVTGDPAGGHLVLGFAETATALGHAVAAGLPAAECVLSTRRPGSGHNVSIAFAEEHSHATAHRVLAPAGVLAKPRAVVLVDDELSSGRTAINTIRALHRSFPHPAYVVAALLDMRPPEARTQFDLLSAELGVPVESVSLLSGSLRVAADAPARVATLVAAADPPQRLVPCWPATRLRAGWPSPVRLGARYGWHGGDEQALAAALEPLVARLAREILPTRVRRVLVLGTEELMYAPLRLAAALSSALASSGARVRYQSTTRSPVAALDREGYAVRCALAFQAPDDPDRQSFVYNVRPGHPDSPDHILVVTDGGHTDSMLDVLRGCAPVTEVMLRDEVTGS